MATVIVPTMRAKVDPNPKGSATTHVTMAEANPFIRETTSIRQANQPNLHQMMPGMGGLGAEVPWYQKIGQSLIDNVGIPLLQQEVLDQPTQNLQTPTNRPLQHTQPTTLPAPTTNKLPTSNAYDYAMRQQQQQQQQSGPNMMPWIIGGVGILAVGGILLMAKGKKKGGGRRRR